jgi:hypothetical protein
VTQIKTTPRTRGVAIAVDEKPEKRRYVALLPLRIGDRWKQPGDLLTAKDLADRNVGSMLRHGQIQQVIEPVTRKPARRPAPRKRSAT